MDVQFRVATYTDVPGIVLAMINSGFAQFALGTLDSAKLASILTEKYFAGENHTTVVVGELNGSIVAYSIFGPYTLYKQKTFPEDLRNYAYSRGTGVLSEFRGQGIGERLRLFADTIAKKQGYLGMYTDVATTNAASLSVQRKTGFTELATVADPKREAGVGSVLFRKDF